MKYRILALFLIFTLLFGTAAYGDIHKSYSFEEAVKIALDNSPELKELEVTIKKASDYFDFLDSHTPSTVKLISNRNEYITNNVNPYMELEKAYTNLKIARAGKDDIKKNIQLGLREILIGIEKAEMAVKETQINKKLLNNQLALLEIQNDEGMISKNDYNNKKRELKDNIKKLDDVDKAVDAVYHQLNMLLGRKDDKDITIKLDDTKIPLEKLDLEQIKKDFIKYSDNSTVSIPSSGSLKNLETDKNLSKLRFNLIDEYFEKYLEKKYDTDKLNKDEEKWIDDVYEPAKKEYEAANKKYSNALTKFDKTFDDMIEDIKDLYDDIEDIKIEIADEKINKSIYKIKYDAGLMSKIEYESLRENIVILENNLKKAELDLNLSYAKLLINSNLKKVVKE